RLLSIHDDGGADAFRRVFAGNKVALNEYLLFQRGEILRIDRVRVSHFRERFDLRLDGIEYLEPLGLFRPTGESETAQIPRESHAAADDHLMVRAFAAQPFAG